MDPSWATFWNVVRETLGSRGYASSTLRGYRSALRGFAASGYRPAQATPERVRGYMVGLFDRGCSANHVANTLSILRAAFDKIGGLAVTRSIRTPKRPMRLPDILSTNEVLRLLQAAPTLRDRLLLGLMAGCGLKVGEVCSLRWGAVDLAANHIQVGGPRQGNVRFVAVPALLRPVLAMGIERCTQEDYVFPGARSGTHLSTSMARLVCRRAADAAGILKPVCCMTLRHTYAVHQLEAGVSVRVVQAALGHRSLETTLRYQACILPGRPGNRRAGEVEPGSLILTPLDEPMLGEEVPTCFEPAHIELPLAGEQMSARSFCNLLQMQITGRFLALRGLSSRSPPRPC